MIIQFNELPTKDENKKMEKLFLAFYFNDREKVIEFKTQYPELYVKKNNFLVDSYTTFDLTNLTLFNQKLWFQTDWIEDVMPLVKKNRERTEQMLGFLIAETGLQINEKNIEYNHYYDFFYCDDPDDSDEIFFEPISTYIEKGFRQIDLMLFNRVRCFDFVQTKKLLEQGAKSNIHFENDECSSAFSYISSECSFLTIVQVIPEFKMFEEKGYKQKFDIKSMFGEILGLIAHEEMYHLLYEFIDKDW